MQQLLENILDALCKATKRDIFVMLPSKERDRVPYLIKEIKTTLDRVQYRGKHMNESTLPLARRLKEMAK
jgi:hypothetical protein